MHPYKALGDDAFWRRAVGDRHFLDVAGLAKPKARIATADRVATAGSCFAQHISRRLRDGGFTFVDVEPAPFGMSAATGTTFGYGLFSARYGNIYTSRQLLQLLLRAFGRFRVAEPVWEAAGRFYDPFRPSIEPDGFTSREEVLASQEAHLQLVARMFRQATVFVFTLGLTEAWRSREDGATYPVCPGTQAGTFDPDRHEFVNLTYDDVMEDMRAFVAQVGRVNPACRFVLTVSPVPLVATASGQHVMVATTHSKAILRAAAGQLSAEFPNVDYFPSYEIVTMPAAGSAFYDLDRRSVRPEAVDFVMRTFLREFCEGQPAGATAEPPRYDRRARGKVRRNPEEVLCDEEALDRRPRAA